MMLVVGVIATLSWLLSVLETAFVGMAIFAASILVLLRWVAAAVLLALLWWVAALAAAVGWVVVVVRAGHYCGTCDEERSNQG